MRDVTVNAKNGSVTKNPPLTDEEILARERAEMKCSSMQGKIALGEQAWGEVEALLDNPETPFDMKVAISSASEWYRNSKMICDLAHRMGYTDEQIDDLFRKAMLVIV